MARPGRLGAGGVAGIGGAGASAAGVAGQSAGSGGLETGGAGAQAGGGSAGTGTSGDGGTDRGFFVEALVDGELFRAEGDVRARWFAGLLPGGLGINADSETFEWALLVGEGEGAQTCGTATITLTRTDVDPVTYLMSNPLAGPEHECSLTIDKAAVTVGDVMEGTFSGLLTPIPGDPEVTVPVTKGSFRAPRVEDAP